MELLKQLCEIPAASGHEGPMKDFILDYVAQNKHKWAVKPEVFESEADFQDGLVLVFGKPRTAVFAHLDSVGFMVRYGEGLIKIGGPRIKSGYKLVGEDSQGPVSAKLTVRIDRKKSGGKFRPDKNTFYRPEKQICYEADRPIERGTPLTFACDFREDEEYVTSAYLDNRLGCYTALRLAETMENGLIAFTCWEEVGGGSAAIAGRFAYQKYGLRQALVCDVSWVTEGVKHGEGPVISLRDSLVPRRNFVDKVLKIADKAGLKYQKEVENSGGSDGKELQYGPYPFDWCFVGPPESGVHSPDEKVHKADIEANLKLYKELIKKL